MNRSELVEMVREEFADESARFQGCAFLDSIAWEWGREMARGWIAERESDPGTDWKTISMWMTALRPYRINIGGAVGALNEGFFDELRKFLVLNRKIRSPKWTEERDYGRTFDQRDWSEEAPFYKIRIEKKD